MKSEDINTDQEQSLLFLDVETTGTNPKEDQIIEIGCVRIDDINRTVFFKEEDIFWSYIKPEIKVKQSSFKIHGISDKFLLDKPKFSHIYQDLFEFIGNRTIVAHNASFDINFLSEELNRLGISPIKNKIIDSLQMAKRLYPGSPVGIDALISRFNMTTRGLHSAKSDAETLARIYIQMTRSRDQQIFFQKDISDDSLENLELCDSIINLGSR